MGVVTVTVVVSFRYPAKCHFSLEAFESFLVQKKHFEFPPPVDLFSSLHY